MNELEDEEIEEITLVAEVFDVLEDESLRKSIQAGDCKIIGGDTDRPIMKIGSHIFLGQFSPVVGTDLIFAEYPGQESLELVAKSDVRLNFHRAFATPIEPQLSTPMEVQPSSDSCELTTDKTS